MYLTEIARKLRKNQTVVESLLWSRIKNKSLNNLKFKRQFIIGNFIVDFVCLEKKLIIELDGSQHLDNKEYDFERTKYLTARVFRVIRFWNNDVNKQIDSVLEEILQNV
jgi:very-short-patch-repair endonuclease